MTVKMVGQVDRKDEISKALKIYVQRTREKQRLEEEAEAEKTRKKKEQEEKKLKEETEFKATKDKLVELTKKHEQLQQDKIKVYEHLKKLLHDNCKHQLEVEDIMKLNDIGLVISHSSTIVNNQAAHVPVCVTTSVIPRTPTVSVNSQYKTITTTGLSVQAITAQKRNRSPSPTLYRSAYPYKQSAGPNPFQKHDDPLRNHEYGRSYPYNKPGNAAVSGNYGAFYAPPQNVPYSHSSASAHSNAAVYSSYSSNRDTDNTHKSHSPPGHPPSNPPSHPSLYASHRGSSAPMQQPNHVYHGKGGQPYGDEKYYMVRSSNNVPVHAVIPIQQPHQSVKHGSITSGYPVRPVVTQMNPSAQIHIQSSHGGHRSSQPPSHLSSQSHHGSQPSHLSTLSSHHPQPHHQSPQSQSILQSSHQSHHQSTNVHYPQSYRSQLHHSSQSSQSSHSSQPPPSLQSHHAGPPHHMQQIHVQSHHPPLNSHHQLLSHHPPSTIHHSSSQQHMQSTIHHPSHHQSQQIHHQQMQSHIQQHISSHEARSQHQSAQQSQPTSVVTSQEFTNQIGSIQGGGRVVYSQPSMSH